ncbi:MAG: recombination mediator RecR [Thermodesulfobacteriota bacterium]
MSRSGLPKPVSRLIDELSKLPGIGEKNATRLAFHILGSKDEYTFRLAQAIVDIKKNVRACGTCFNITSENPCDICTDNSREQGLICVVEDPMDLIAVERSRVFSGLYHVLNGVIAPLEGIGPEDLTIGPLINRLKENSVKEIIIATNPSVEGEATSLYIARLVKPLGIKVSRIAHGIPMGGDLEYTDELTIGKALRDRKEI